MSVNTEYFVIYGLKGDYKMFYSTDGEDIDDVNPNYLIRPDINRYSIDKGHNYLDNPKTIFLSDGMGGEYSIFGLLIQYAGDFEDLDLSISTGKMLQLDDLFYEVCVNQDVNLCGSDIPKLHIFKHYT